jgi:NADP-dependent 3-hydroxy acid dehydrogenase YdfG
LDYHTALVTGASKGIGAGIAEALVAAGLTVYALARDEAALLRLSERLGPRLRPIAVDVTAIDLVATRLGDTPIDVLVNNAGGLASVRPLHEQTASETADAIALNLTAPLQLIRLLLPGMIARRLGHIFNVTSTAAHAVFPGTTTYGATKAGLSHAGRILRYDLAGTGVRLTEIAPGRVETDFYLEAFSGDRETLQKKLYSQQRPLAPEDVATVLVSALRLPPHVDVSELTVAPTDQAVGGHVYKSLSERD